jgi:hypothetical protein
MPSFTLESIFNIKSKESVVILRELGFGNIAMGLSAVASLALGAWRVPVALVVGLFLGLDAVQHGINIQPVRMNGLP